MSPTSFKRMAVILLAAAFAAMLSASVANADDWADCRAEQEMALTACTAIIERGGNSKELMEAHTRRGNVRNRSGDLDGALADANRAVELDPHVNALFLRANVRARRREWSLAIADYSRIIELQPTHTMAYVNRGRVLTETGALNDALVDLDRAIGLDPSSPDAFYARGDFYRRRGELDSAISDYSRSIALKVRSPAVLAARGDAFSARGNLDRAIEDYDHFLAANPTDKRVRDRRDAVIAQKAELARNDGLALRAAGPTAEPSSPAFGLCFPRTDFPMRSLC